MKFVHPRARGESIWRVAATRELPGRGASRWFAAVKITVFVPPLAVLTAGGFWLGSLRGTTGTLERETATLRERIRSSDSDSGFGDDDRLVPGSGAALMRTPLTVRELKEIGPSLTAEESGGMPDLRLLLRFKTRISAMSAPEILALIGEITASDMPKLHRDLIESELCDQLSEIDPRAYLDHLTDRLAGGHDDSWRMSHTFEQWMETDPSAASAWFDRMLADGKFEARALDGKNEVRVNFEAPMVRSMLGGDPTAVAARIAAIPENQRLDFFSHSQFAELEPGTEKPFADQVRRFIPSDLRAGAFPQLKELAEKPDGLAQVSSFLGKIEADSAESSQLGARAVAFRVSELADDKELDLESLREIHSWTRDVAAGSQDEIIGRALASSVASSDLEMLGEGGDEMGGFDLISKLHEDSGGDDLLLAFLDEDLVAAHPGEAATLAAKIQNTDRREELLRRIASINEQQDGEDE
jgi:hypothetical protein